MKESEDKNEMDDVEVEIKDIVADKEDHKRE